MNIYEALADNIMRFEGWYPAGSPTSPNGSTSWRNRNPGNLRPFNDTQEKDARNYRIFHSLSEGWDALLHDLAVKFSGKSIHKLTPQSTLHDLFSIYAPALDQNDPQQYSRIVAQGLSKIYGINITPDWTLESLQKLG